MTEDWYVNFGDFVPGRDWEDAREYGFVSGGWGEWYSRTLRRVPVGARVWVYRPPMTGRGTKRPGGYVGRGVVIAEPMPADEAELDVRGERRRFTELHLRGTYTGNEKEEDAEWVLPVRWELTISPQAPVTQPRIFTNRNTAVQLDPAKPAHAKTLAFLKESSLGRGLED
jgi:hypothetical protein